MNPKEPLWLPRGSVRAILALLLVGMLCWLALTGKFEAEDFRVIVAVVVTFYFAGKANQAPPT
jgi:hypothetical protein